MRAIRGSLLAATALLVGTGLAACSSGGTTQAAGTPQATVSATPSLSSSPTTAPSTALATAASTAPSTAENTTPRTAASPVSSHCPAAPGTEVIAADGVTTVDGAFAVTGYVESATCGPGVPDDVIYQDSGSHRAFVLASGVKVTLVSGDGVRSASGTLPELESLLEDAFGGTSAAAHPAPSGIGLGSHYFGLTLGTGGQITGIESLYHP